MIESTTAGVIARESFQPRCDHVFRRQARATSRTRPVGLAQAGDPFQHRFDVGMPTRGVPEAARLHLSVERSLSFAPAAERRGALRVADAVAGSQSRDAKAFGRSREAPFLSHCEKRGNLALEAGEAIGVSRKHGYFPLGPDELGAALQNPATEDRNKRVLPAVRTQLLQEHGRVETWVLIRMVGKSDGRNGCFLNSGYREPVMERQRAAGFACQPAPKKEEADDEESSCISRADILPTHPVVAVDAGAREWPESRTFCSSGDRCKGLSRSSDDLANQRVNDPGLPSNGV